MASILTRAIRAASVLAQKVPAGIHTRLGMHLPGTLGAHCAFLETKAGLGQGMISPSLSNRVSRILSAADRWERRRCHALATELFDEAIQLAFHPTVHADPSGSPLGHDTEAFLAPLRGSVVARLMRERPDPVQVERSGGQRALVVSHGSWTFAQRVIEAVRRKGVEIDTFDLSTLPHAQRPSHRTVVRARADFARTGALLTPPPALAAALDGIDTLFVEWGTYPLAWLSLMDLGDVRLVARLHRFEAFTPYPLLTRFSRVDEILMISPSVRELVRSGAPRLSQAHRVSTVANPHDYTPFHEEKREGAERTLVQVGWSIPVKDAHFSLDTLEILRREDPRWRLLLVGDPLPAQPEPRLTAFTESLRDRIRAAGDAVEVLGRQDDMPSVFEKAGFVLSSSIHEGSHESVAEGAAGGCVPVVRNWPDAAGHCDGAASIYPREWIVSTPVEAASRILAFTDPRARSAEGADAAAWVRTHREPSAVIAPYVQALTRIAR